MSLPEAVQLEKFCFWPVLDGLGPDCTIVTLAIEVSDVSSVRPIDLLHVFILPQ